VWVVFTAANVGALLYSVKKSLDGLDAAIGLYGRVSLFFANRSDLFFDLFFELFMRIVAPVGVAMIAISFDVLVTKIDNYFKPELDTSSWGSEVLDHGVTRGKIEWGCPNGKRLKQALLLAQFVSSVALVCLSSHPLLFAASASFQLYSLLKTTEIKWLKISRSVTYQQVAGYENRRSISYQIPLFSGDKSEEECSICRESLCSDNKRHNVLHFCQHHKFHTSCIAKHIYVQSSQFLNNVTIENPILGERSTMKCSIKLKKDVLPSCPLCRKPPIDQDIKVTTVWLSGDWSRHACTYSPKLFKQSQGV